MIEKIIEWSVRNKFMVVLATLFVIAGGVTAMLNTPLDAIPDLSDVQVIIYTEYSGQGPQVVEDQVTYPLTTAMLSVPYAKVVRGYSFFGLSFVYIIFEDGTDLYWARSRVLEYLNFVSGRLPQGVTPSLGPDATGVGWVYEYVLKDTTGKYDLQQLRSFQDWYLRYELTAVPGVSEVAGIGGFVKQYQVTVDPNRLLAYNLPIQKIRQAIQRSNADVGGKLIEMAETEFMVRGLGYIQSIEDMEKIAVGVDAAGTPILLKNVANIQIGPDLRRGIAEWNGEGEIVGGVVVMRFGENALEVIRKVKAKLKALEKGLPEGVIIETAYDRSGLIERAVATLKKKLVEEMTVVAVICVIFLLHLRSAFVAIFTIPVGILISFLVMYRLGINANIMSLGGIAIAIGVMVDASVVMVENAHKHLERDRGNATHAQIIIDASKEVGPALFYSLLIITVSFLPVFALGEQSGRMFKPLAYTKTFAMAASSILAITIVPVLMTFFVREQPLDPTLSRKKKRWISILSVAASPLLVSAAGILGLDLPDWSLAAALGLSLFILVCLIPQPVTAEATNPISRFFIRMYLPLIKLVLKWRKTTVTSAVLIILVTGYPASRLGSEFMPPLNEGDLLYMPTTLPGISITKARELLQQTDKIIQAFPEVHHTFGKIGRADTPTDPAPLSMIETTIMLRPHAEYEVIHVDRFFSDWPGWLKYPLTWLWPEEKNGKLLHEWRRKKVDRWFSDWPGWLKAPLTWIWPEKRYMTTDELVDDLNAAIQFPGLTNAWTMPIKTRIDMLSTGIKTPVGIKLMGSDLQVLSDLGERIEAVVRDIPGTLSAFSERVTGGNYFDFNIRRTQIARYGLTVNDVQEVIMTAIGGMNVTYTVEGLERYPVNLRYDRELRDNIDRLRRVLVATPTGTQVPLAQLAEISIHKGPAGIKSENARRSAWIYVDLKGVDVGTYVETAKKIVDEAVKLPAGYSMVWSGQYEYMERARRTLNIIVPATLAVIFILLYIHFNSIVEATVVMASLPFALVGGVWLIYLLGYNLSVAVVVGFIALSGLAAETGVVMLVYLDEVYARRRAQGEMGSPEDLKAAIIEGAVDRVRPKIMTVATTLIGLLPVMYGSETGSETMKRIAAPMVGGLVSSTVLTLVIIPVVYDIWKRWELKRAWREEDSAG
ncbi:efflux RND transporter permease subunit [Desulfococcus multivorans]|uniref:Acriflavin resistance protein n=1 Tax=Desulfococcus multivorans DSM 2059 TaxID=1121405 RepID=S7T5Y7_DESML|nr:efflux RND transporter permease subunit [Desulfococcus multivorans]AQV01631.1 cation transporter [Desulfococcus multivorans]EPR32467.1 acriflavin resistance protein [Desulfococcus multivorans DSM 2059]SKA00573.1 Cu(I)/Ag(I) efflux system membrane protein CusA/SilA [Desulfococcus multivorans DSM 2059]